MEKQHISRPLTLRFKRWSRKGYAAFISIQRAVTIGHLSAHVSERFQTKNESVHTSVLSEECNTDNEAEGEPDLLKDNVLQEVGIAPQLIVLLSVQTGKLFAAPKFANRLKKIIPKERKVQLLIEPSALFLCK